eukprot:CAMPEP_0202925208 /NCGR_PEP_ID=MMETSP1392-20130828/79377_1 /ASSEMBLY_ACC=CAM_ASM_000868 /TAXON_ID=225041 /ORGANISM="Chlamydomonas chlamydogama, Strain SAG 11-48b" /LENGTH=55 /DNA_ID=CAMNT_0049618973 /DNA_START=1148 /DNA_END=1315 /DNA_ORIENTATION=-
MATLCGGSMDADGLQPPGPWGAGPNPRYDTSLRMAHPAALHVALVPWCATCARKK